MVVLYEMVQPSIANICRGGTQGIPGGLTKGQVTIASGHFFIPPPLLSVSLRCGPGIVTVVHRVAFSFTRSMRRTLP